MMAHRMRKHNAEDKTVVKIPTTTTVTPRECTQKKRRSLVENVRHAHTSFRADIKAKCLLDVLRR